MTWLFYVLFGQLCLALAVATDKIFLNKFIRSGFVFALLVGLLSLFALFLIPFGVRVPSLGALIINFIAGVALSVGLLLFFVALARDEATRVAPFIGGLMPIATITASYFILGETLTKNTWRGIIFLIAGSVLLIMSLYHKPEKSVRQAPVRLSTYIIAFGSAAATALSFVLGRMQFVTDGFITSFFWQRTGTLAVAIILLCLPMVRKGAHQAILKLRWFEGGIFLASKGVGALGYMLISYATKLISASIVNALGGVQYLFLLILASVATLAHPKLWREEVAGFMFIKKVLAIGLIAAGLFEVARFG